MADFVELLVGMGFEPEKAKKAVEVTGNKGVEPAMEWLLANPGSDSVSSPAPAENKTEGGGPGAEAGNNPPTSTEDATVRSYKCDECGKIFKDATEMEFHAAKTQHSKFSESTDEKKPLTAEEKAEQLKRIDEKLKVKRAERELREKEEAIVNERSRIKHGKEILEAKRRNEEMQMKEIAEARRREKLEEKQARERVRAQIEADKIARKAKQDAAMGISSAVPTPAASATPSPSISKDHVTSPKKDYTEAKLQLRLPSGKSITQTFKANECLAAVRLYVEMNRDDGITGPFNLMTNFPRKVFLEEDYNAPLQALGLVPTAVLQVTKSV